MNSIKRIQFFIIFAPTSQQKQQNIRYVCKNILEWQLSKNILYIHFAS